MKGIPATIAIPQRPNLKADLPGLAVGRYVSRLAVMGLDDAEVANFKLKGIKCAE